MSGLRMTKAQWRRACAASTLALFLAACGNTDNLFHGIRFSRDGSTLVVASLMPACSCMTVASTRKKGEGDVMLVARLHGRDVGEMILNPTRPERVLSDWAGANNEDVYELSAFAVENGQRGQALVPMQSHVIVYGDATATSCSDTSCPFGSLNMSQAWTAQLGQDQVERHSRGATMTRNGQVLEVSSLLNKCGCVILRNPTDTNVMLEGSLRGHETGSVVLHGGEDLHIAYDWAGTATDDVYTISAASAPQEDLTSAPAPVVPQPQRGGGAAPALPALPDNGSMMTSALKLSDYAHMVAQLDEMACTELGSSMTSKEMTLGCRFEGLNLNQIVTTSAAVKPSAGSR